jgi:hypothetical protein
MILAQEKLEVVGRFEEKVKKIDDFCAALNEFDKTIKTIDTWMKNADGQVICNCKGFSQK